MTPSGTRTEFQIDQTAFMRAARRRMLVRMGLASVFFAALAWLAQAYFRGDRASFFWTGVLALLFVHGAVELSSLQWARRSAPVMVVRLMPKGLECWIGPNCHRMPWTTLPPPRIRRWRGQVTRIDVMDSRGQGVRLAGFQDMDALARGIVEGIGARP
ncbi:MAG: hypothetical protein ACT4QA_05845 [Panacagrimonas sp.]